MPDISVTIERPSDVLEDAFMDAMEDFLALLIDLTPVATGLCASSWDADISSDEATFSNSCDYSSYLDEGWSSQASDGMINPALDQLPGILDDAMAKYYK